jgi:SSS family transporter
MLGIEAIDWAVIIFYLVGITFIGLWAVKKVRSSASFFIGDRKFGKIMMAFFMFGSGTHSDQAVSVASKTYSSGASGIWYQWLWLFVTPFFWLIAPFFRRMRALTTGDYFEVRYGRSVSGLYALMGILPLLVAIGVMLKGSGAMVEAVSGGEISSNLAIIAMTIMFVIYGVAGGLSAAIATNFVQGLLTIVLSFIILPFALSEVGGMSGLRESISNPDMLSLVSPGEITLFYIIIIAFNALVGWVTMPETMANCAAGKTEMEGRIGVTTGIFGKRICTIAWMLTGLCAIVMYDELANADLAYGTMARDLLPDIAPGLIGLFIAGMLASIMSTCDSLMVVASALFTENIYKKFLVVGKDDKHYTLIGRIASALVVILGIFVAFKLESVVQGLEFYWMASALMGIAFWVGLYWRRATVAGAWAATLTSFAVVFLTMYGPVVWFVGQMPFAKQARFVFVKETTPSPLLHDLQLKDASSLALKFREGGDALSVHIQKKLSEETRDLLSQYDSSTDMPKDLQERLVAELNLLIQGKLENTKEEIEPLYDESRFEHVMLSNEIQELISKKPEGDVLVKLNRRLLEEAYPAEILRSWQFSGHDIKKPVALANKLNQAKEAVSLYIRERLSDQTIGLIANPESMESTDLSQAIASEFNRIARGESIYDQSRFAEVFTSENTIKLTEKNLRGEDLIKLNNYLLEEAFIWEITKNRGIEIHLPWQMIIYLSAGFIVLIVVSLFTKRVSAERLERFYECLRTPIRPGEPETQPFTLPTGVEPAPRNVLISHPDFEIPKPSIIGIGGFLVAWAGVALLIGAVYRIIG